MDDLLEQLAAIAPEERVLLLSHCLRPSATCPGKANKQGLVCPEDCAEDCPLGRFQRAARELGYKGVCIAPGGSLALRVVKELAPQGMVVVACQKELDQGAEGVSNWVATGRRMPVVVAVPLSSDGCVDTSVDEERVLEAIRIGCNGHRAGPR